MAGGVSVCVVSGTSDCSLTVVTSCVCIPVPVICFVRVYDDVL